MPIMLINRHYSFNTYAPSILGASYRNAKLIGILDYTSAIKIKNIEQLHRQVYPYLIPGTPNDLTSYTYYHFVVGQTEVVLSSYWIVESSIEEVTSVNINIRVFNTQPSDVQIIRDQLSLLGYTFDIGMV